MAYIEVHPLGASHKTVAVNTDQIEKINDYGSFTRLHLVGGGYQDVKEKKRNRSDSWTLSLCSTSPG
jgi:hypothetical protein